MCQIWNGGCAAKARCSQINDKVSCTCPKGHSGDGFTCQPIDPCVSGDNGGCHEHATCTMTAPVRMLIFSGMYCTTRMCSANVCVCVCVCVFRGRRNAPVSRITLETVSPANSNSYQSAAVSKTTEDAIKMLNVRTSTLKVKSDWTAALCSMNSSC